MNQYGHFGLSSIRLVAMAVGGLLLHIILPYGYLQFHGPAAPDGEILTRGEMMEFRDFVPGEMLSSNASPDVVLAGFIIAAAGGILLTALGFQPLQVSAARWVGHIGGLLGGIGAAMVWMGSMYSVGTGFAALLGNVFPGEFRAYFWAISPVITAVLGGWMTYDAIQVGRKVVATRDGLRESVDRAFRHAGAALVFMGVVLLVPWSIGILPDGVSDGLGTEVPGEGKGAYWFSAEDVQSVTAAESAWRFRYSADGDFNVLSGSLHVMVGLGWTAVAAAWLQAMMATATSSGGPMALVRAARFSDVAVVLMWGAAGIMYVLAWIFVRPNPDVEHVFLPGFLPILVLGPYLWLAKQLLPTTMGLLQGEPQPAAE